MTSRSFNERKLISYAVALTPLLFGYYAIIQQILISDLIIISCALYLYTRGYTRIPRIFLISLVLFASWTLLIHSYHSYSSKQLANLSDILLPARFLGYYFLAVPVGLYFRQNTLLINTIITLSLLFAGYSVFQLVVYRTTGIPLITSVPFLSQRFGLQMLTDASEIIRNFGYRPSSLFSEPAHLAQFSAIGALLLIQMRQSGNIALQSRYFSLKILLLLGAPLAAGSGTAAFSVLFVLVVVFSSGVWSGLSKGSIKSNLFTISALVLVLLALALLFETEALSRAFSSLVSGSTISETSAVFVRVLRPFQYVSVLWDRGEMASLAFGHGFGSYAKVLKSSNLTTIYEESARVYWTNTFGLIVSAVGLVGFILFSLIFVALSVCTGKTARYLVIFLYSSVFFSDMAASGFVIPIIALAISTRPHTHASRHFDELTRQS